MEKLTRDDMMRLALTALATFGEKKQLRRFTEECGESVTAAMKLHDNRGTLAEFAEEVVGVIITAAQMETWLVGLIGCDEMNAIWSDQLAKLAKAIEEAR